MLAEKIIGVWELQIWENVVDDNESQRFWLTRNASTAEKSACFENQR
jgi:hypothetical protein